LANGKEGVSVEEDESSMVSTTTRLGPFLFLGGALVAFPFLEAGT